MYVKFEKQSLKAMVSTQACTLESPEEFENNYVQAPSLKIQIPVGQGGNGHWNFFYKLFSDSMCSQK